MKDTLLTFVVFLLTLSTVQSQITEGEIIYELKVNLHENLPERMAHLRGEIPEYRSSKHHLLFNQKESYFYQEEGERPNEMTEMSDRRQRWLSRRMRNQENIKLYTDLSNQQSLESRTFLGKSFLITGAPNEFKWKFTGEMKQVGSFLCQKAVHQDSTESVEVWFTPMIPIAAGPQHYLGLPGMVLHVDINNGSRVITALDVKPGNLADASLQKPTEGQNITREAFQKMVQEKMKEREMERGSQRRMFRTRN